MGLFSKKKSRDDIIAEAAAAEVDVSAQEKKEDTVSTGNAKLDMELTMIKAQLESFGEVRKANSERFSRMSEQMGELRGMILDTNKTISKIEVSATKAIDLVESVQPEKLMIEVRREDGKVEALRANIESNETMMHDLMEEIKKMRQQMNFYKGIEQVAKLNDEVKGEIFEIKKVEATIERQADKAETIFLDLEKKMAEFDRFEKTIEDIEKSFHQFQEDFDKIKIHVLNKAEKKEFLTLMDKFTEFEKHTGDVMKLLDERSKQSKVDMKAALDNMKRQLSKKGTRISVPDDIPSLALPQTEPKEHSLEPPKSASEPPKKEAPKPSPEHEKTGEKKILSMEKLGKLKDFFRKGKKIGPENKQENKPVEEKPAGPEMTEDEKIEKIKNNFLDELRQRKIISNDDKPEDEGTEDNQQNV